ncbi:MAG: hypothetical protein V7767_09585 [Leeuwenhoekiella sp.]
MRIFTKKAEVEHEWQQAIKKPIPINCVQINEEFQVKTLEGLMLGKPGDWLIEGVEGELYACDDKIFKKTYNLQ